MTPIENRSEFVFLFDVTNGNPNGDPDDGNRPRIDSQTQKGLVTDVCLKRKIRNYVQMVKGGEPPYGIYMQERAVLNRQHELAYKALGITPVAKKLPKDEAQARDLTAWMCRNFFDIRTFGAVMTTDVNAGQVRGPVQLSFAQSIDKILPDEVSITRASVTNERDADKERTMGRKFRLPYALFRAHGFVSANLAGDVTKGTGFSGEDLELVYEALVNMFDHDRSAARGEMSACKIFEIRHASRFGNGQAQALFRRIEVALKPDVTFPRSRDDYLVTVNWEGLPPEIEIIERL